MQISSDGCCNAPINYEQRFPELFRTYVCHLKGRHHRGEDEEDGDDEVPSLHELLAWVKDVAWHRVHVLRFLCNVLRGGQRGTTQLRG